MSLVALGPETTGLRVVTMIRLQPIPTGVYHLLDPETVVEFPSWETLPHERLSPRSDTVGRRLAVLRRLVCRTLRNRPAVGDGGCLIGRTVLGG